MHSLLYASAVRKSGDEVRGGRAVIPAKQVSGFIDLATRVRQESFLPYLTGQRRLRPKPGDLTYANISKRKSKLCSSDIWKVGEPTFVLNRPCSLRDMLSLRKPVPAILAFISHFHLKQLDLRNDQVHVDRLAAVL